MKHLQILLWSITIGLALGCASNEWKAHDIPLPRTTPFDSNEFARTAYLQGYRQGYEAQMYGTTGVEMLTGPYLAARHQGFYVGAAQARLDATQKSAE